MAAVRRLSGMQKAVLSLYKQCLRTVGTKPVVGPHPPPPLSCCAVRLGVFAAFTSALREGRRSEGREGSRARQAVVCVVCNPTNALLGRIRPGMAACVSLECASCAAVGALVRRQNGMACGFS